MKTNQVMIREVGYLQRTSDGYFNGTALLETWNRDNGYRKQLGNYQSQKETKEFIEQLKKEGIEKPMITGRGKGENQGTWMHPKLFIDLAMWISVEFKSKVIDMVLDGLIISRTDAGDYYNEMTAVIMEKYIEFKGCKPPATLYINEANMIREMAGVGDKDRNEMTENELAKITTLQKVNANLISKNVGKESRKKHLLIIAESI